MASELMLPATTRHERIRGALRGLAIVHPVPSVMSAALVASLALVAGGEPVVAGLLAMAMLGFQVSIGTLNDVVDAGRDRLAKPKKPIPAGLVSRRLAAAVVIIGGAVGLAISASYGMAVPILGAAGYGSGLAYDIFMRRLGLGWLCFSAAFPLLLAWTWMAAAGILPPGWPLLLPLAALAGPVIHLANSLVDADADDRAGVPSLATQLGPQRARHVLAVLVVLVYVLGWATLFLVGATPLPVVLAAVIATLAAALGVALSRRESPQAREAGWLLQASGLAILAVAWLAAMSEA